MFDVCSDRFSFLGEQAKGGRGVRVGRARAPRESNFVSGSDGSSGSRESGMGLVGRREGSQRV